MDCAAGYREWLAEFQVVGANFHVHVEHGFLVAVDWLENLWLHHIAERYRRILADESTGIRQLSSITGDLAIRASLSETCQLTKQSPPEFSPDFVCRLWLARQGLLTVEAPRRLNRNSFVAHLEATGGLQVDSVNVVDRAHYLTLWSRFGAYDRAKVDRWIYRDRVALEYWGHEASILPMSDLPLAKRRMQRFPPDRWRNASYWARYDTSPESKRRVLKLLKLHGPLMSSDFEPTSKDSARKDVLGWGSLIPKEDKRSLQLLWHAGKVAIVGRKHFHKQYDLAEKVLPAQRPATKQEYFDSWLLRGLSGCGIATEAHLVNYITGPNLTAPERAEVLARNLKKKKIVEVQVTGLPGRWFALPRVLDEAGDPPKASGLTLICPFDSLLWQRKRAEQLLNFKYRVEIYVPEKKREYGYYVLPILYRGQLVGRLDPKLHRDRGELEIKSLVYEPSFKATKAFRRELTQRIENFAAFLGAETIKMPSTGAG